MNKRGDLISREALKKDLQESYAQLKRIYETLHYSEEKQICSAELCVLTEAILRVKDAPAVDAVEVVHAKWGKFGIDYKHEASLYECSACGKIVRKYWEDERFECCPYCFARMDGDGNGEA